MRRCCQKVDKNVSYTTTELNKDVTLHPNPSYDVVKANTVDSLYDTIKPGDSDVPITSNPSYNVPTKPYSEDEYNYVQPNEYNQHSDTIKMHTNPSYGLTTGEDRATAFSSTSESADTKAGHSSHATTTEEHDYVYAQDDHLLHQNTTVNATDDTKITRSPYLTFVSNDAKAHNGSAAK